MGGQTKAAMWRKFGAHTAVYMTNVTSPTQRMSHLSLRAL